MTPSEHTVREVRADDLEALVELYRHLIAADDPPPPERLRAAWQAMLDDPRHHCFVVESGGRPVATCTLLVVPNLTHGAQPYGVIENVVTHPDHRRRGLGTAVLRHALAFAWGEGCYKVMLLTGRREEEILSFYEQAGFRRDVKTGFLAAPPAEPTGD
jgi:GNAT superfamily N-acetyltransferase